MKDIEKELKFHSTNISTCCRGKSKTAYGYKWRYAQELLEQK